MSPRSKEQRDTCRQQQVPHDHQIAFPAEERRFLNGDGTVDKGNESHQRYSIIKEAIKPERVTQFLLHVLCHRCGYQGAVKSTPQYPDRKSTRLNSSHGYISYAVFCLKKK